MATQPVRTYWNTTFTVGRLILAVAFVVLLAAAFGWVNSTDVSVGWLGVALIALGLAIG